ncbi:MAG: hypothetical protein OEM85_10175 [Gammaproteobacteria bacterium]|nr:hypothetical protein [Gammaproteobacteria bacterium]MDH3373727.1 hypothetical protein [Gammaproteobacteria bacterium]MDH3409269.1 hypothetical protein [Gammaproteobacteria bacterium]
MTISDETLREQVSRAWRRAAGEDHSSFDSVWQSAQQRHAALRRRYRRFASVAAVAAVIVIGLNLQTAEEEATYIEIADLLDSTYWSAPSDVLLPDREFDIYRDMPVLFESTEPAGGALL